MTCPFSPAQASLTQLVHEEDGAPYQVYRIEADGKHYILKQAKEYEAEVYQKLLKDAGSCVPKIYATAEAAGETYLLMEYIPGGRPAQMHQACSDFGAGRPHRPAKALLEQRFYRGLHL